MLDFANRQMTQKDFILEEKVNIIKSKAFPSEIQNPLNLVRLEWFLNGTPSNHGIFVLPMKLVDVLSKTQHQQLINILQNNSLIEDIAAPFTDGSYSIPILPVFKRYYGIKTLSYYKKNGFERLCYFNSKKRSISLERIISKANELVPSLWELKLVEKTVDTNDPRVIFEDEYQILWGFEE